MNAPATDIAALNETQVRTLAQQLIEQVAEQSKQLTEQRTTLEARDQQIAEQTRELTTRQVKINQLTHEMAVLKRLKFAAQSERFDSGQLPLIAEAIDEDLSALALEIEAVRPAPEPGTSQPAHAQPTPSFRPKRQALPEQLPRTPIHHEPESTQCACGCALRRIGEDVSEKLDYRPGSFSVERHIRGKWVCTDRACAHGSVVQAPMPAHVIDKGLATPGLLAQVLIAKYADHLPLFRQEGIYARAGLRLARSSLAQWVGESGVQLQPVVDALKAALLQERVLHADETPVALLDPGSGKTHRAYLWAYASTVTSALKAVVYDFAASRAGAHARAFLTQAAQDQAAQDRGAPGAPWCGTLVCDDYGGYKALFAGAGSHDGGVREAGCLAHARRKFHELWASQKSPLAEQALKYFKQLYDVEREVAQLNVQERSRIREREARPIADALKVWLIEHRSKLPDGGAMAKAIDYSLRRWTALTHYLSDGEVPADNNWIENRIRPIALGRKNWLFAGSLRAGQRAAAIMSLIESARMNDLDPYAYLKDLLTRLPTHKMKDIGELLPHRWQQETSPR
jgi:transposase